MTAGDVWDAAICTLHTSPLRCVLAVTGGGSGAIAALLRVPGASGTVLEAAVPYSRPALSEWLRRPPEHACADETALPMAAVAWDRAVRFARAEAGEAGDFDSMLATLWGVGATAALVSTRPKRGDHRMWLALHSLEETRLVHLLLCKGARDRTGEEDLCRDVILHAVCDAAGVQAAPPRLGDGDALEVCSQRASEAVRGLMQRSCPGTQTADAAGIVVRLPGGADHALPSIEQWPAVAARMEADAARAGEARPRPGGVVCGAFHPLHRGHCRLRAVAEDILGQPVWYEMTLRNADKPPLDYLSLARRARQFDRTPLVLTVVPRFVEKARVLPNTVFVVGIDTAERVLQPRYYGDSAAAMREALEAIRRSGCRFLVAGRREGGAFRTLEHLDVPAEFADLFAGIPEALFHEDVSSTTIRRLQSPLHYPTETELMEAPGV